MSVLSFASYVAIAHCPVNNKYVYARQYVHCCRAIIASQANPDEIHKKQSAEGGLRLMDLFLQLGSMQCLFLLLHFPSILSVIYYILVRTVVDAVFTIPSFCRQNLKSRPISFGEAQTRAV